MSPTAHTECRNPGLSEPKTKEQWRRYLTEESPPAPQLPPYRDYLRLPPEEAEDLVDARCDYHSALVIVDTPQMRDIDRAVNLRLRLNRYAPAGARRGIAIDGVAEAGKSTAVKQIARRVELRMRAKHPEQFTGPGPDFAPIAYISLDDKATPRTIATSLNRFYSTGDVSNSDTAARLNDRAVRAMHRCSTLLIIVDDIHFLNISIKDGKYANDYLKSLMNSVPATFLYTGIEIVGSGLFQEGGSSRRKTQTAGRFTAYQMGWFTVRNKAEAEQWIRVVAGFEDALSLYHHRPRSLATKHWRYLHERTQGSIAALSALLRESAIDSILTGEEAVTVDVLDRQRTSINTQKATVDDRPRPRRRKKGATAEAQPSPVAL